jgi:hypothetical protein
MWNSEEQSGVLKATLNAACNVDNNNCHQKQLGPYALSE